MGPSDSGLQLPHREASSLTDRAYNSHVKKSRRNTINMASLQMLFLTLVYILTYEMGIDIEDDYD